MEPLVPVSLLQQAEYETEAWFTTASQYARNAEYYRGLLVQIGEVFGEDARRCADGSIAQDVLCARLPELVRQRIGGGNAG